MVGGKPIAAGGKPITKGGIKHRGVVFYPGHMETDWSYFCAFNGLFDAEFLKTTTILTAWIKQVVQRQM